MNGGRVGVDKKKGERRGEEGKLECVCQSLHTDSHALLYVIQNNLPKHLVFMPTLQRRSPKLTEFG